MLHLLRVCSFRSKKSFLCVENLHKSFTMMKKFSFVGNRSRMGIALIFVLPWVIGEVVAANALYVCVLDDL